MAKPEVNAAGCAAQVRATVMQLSRHLRSGIQRDGISTAKLSVIGQLYRNGPMTPTELAVREGVKLQSLTRLLAELESEGFLARKAHASDGRQTLLSLTPPGAKRLVTAVQAGDAALARVMAASLGADECALLLRACTLLDSLGEALLIELHTDKEA